MKRIFTALFLYAALSVPALVPPAMNGPVNDYAGLLDSAEKRQLTDFLTNLSDTKGIQIAVLTLPSLEGDDLERFSIRTAEQWKLGKKGEDNGALLLIAVAEKKIRIEVGYGLESTLTDMQSGSIIRNIIAPAFRSGNYGKGIIGAVQTMANLAAGDVGDIDESYASEISDDDPAAASRPSAFVLFLFFVFMMIAMNRRRRHFGRYRGSGFARSAATAAFLSSLSKHSSGTSRWSSGSWGGSSFGGGSGGGFSGGGGGFGGGGASGGW